MQAVRRILGTSSIGCLRRRRVIVGTSGDRMRKASFDAVLIGKSKEVGRMRVTTSVLIVLLASHATTQAQDGPVGQHSKELDAAFARAKSSVIRVVGQPKEGNVSQGSAVLLKKQTEGKETVGYFATCTTSSPA